MTAVWTIDEALKLIRYLQPILHQQGWHVALGGGVLNKGFSEKDLDLYFFPFGSREGVDTKSLERWLELLWGAGEEMSFYRDGDEEVFLTKKKYYPPDGRRIDVFIGAKKQTFLKKIVEKFSLWKYGGRRMLQEIVHEDFLN